MANEAAPGAVANAVMTPDPTAAQPIAAPQRRKVSDLTNMVQRGEMPEMVSDPAARSNTDQTSAPRTLDAPLFADQDFTDSEAHDPAAIEPFVEPSFDAEVVDPAEYAKIQQLMSSPELSEPFLDKLVNAPGPDGKPWKVSVRACIQGFLREEDYSRKQGELAAERNMVRTARAGLEKLLGQMETTDGFLYAMRVLGKWGTEPAYAGGQVVRPGTGFLGACYAVGEQLAEELKLRESNPAAYAQLQQRRAAEQRAFEAEQRALHATNAAQQAVATQQPAPDQVQQRTMHQLEQLMPRALQSAHVPARINADPAFGEVWEAKSQWWFDLHWTRLLPTLTPEQLDSGPSADFVQMVVNATVQSCQRQAAEGGRPIANPNLPPPNQGFAGAPVRQGQPGSNGMPKRAQIGDMGKILQTYR
jgi:hypothetical protein